MTFNQIENLMRGNVRTKHSHPYSYDPVPQFNKAGIEPTSTIYTDRLLMWDFKRHDALCEKHFGNRAQYWNDRAPAKIEAFLRDWCDDPTLELCAVTEYCNQATGYPVWRLDYWQDSQITEPSLSTSAEPRVDG